MKKRRLILTAGSSCLAAIVLSGKSSSGQTLKESIKSLLNAVPDEYGKNLKKAKYIGYHLTNQDPNSPIFKALSELWKIVHKKTDGWLLMSPLAYDANLPAADTEAVWATADNRFDAISVAAPILDNSMSQVLLLQQFLFAFKNSQEAFDLLQNELYISKLDTLSNQYNFKYMRNGTFNAGMRQITSTEGHPLKNFNDLKGFILRIPPSTSLSEQLMVLDIKPQFAAVSNVYQLLKTKKVMGQENPNAFIESYHFNQVCKYLNITNHLWSGFNTFIRFDAWNSWPKEIQAVVEDELLKAQAFQWKAQENMNSYITANAFKLFGMTVIETDLKGVGKKLVPIQQKLIEQIDPELRSLAKNLTTKVFEL